MLNYIRSELYRITHTRAAFLTTAILSAGILASISCSISGAAA